MPPFRSNWNAHLEHWHIADSRLTFNIMEGVS
jgi:hypothetical protein